MSGMTGIPALVQSCPAHAGAFRSCTRPDRRSHRLRHNRTGQTATPPPKNNVPASLMLPLVVVAVGLGEDAQAQFRTTFGADGGKVEIVQGDDSRQPGHTTDEVAEV